MGSSALVSGAIMLVGGRGQLSEVESRLSWAALLLGVVLVLLGWIKLAQQSVFLMNHRKAEPEAEAPG
jgi:lysylphosphatidylglycerol synthetase-like protein (DUF2156 family)